MPEHDEGTLAQMRNYVNPGNFRRFSAPLEGTGELAVFSQPMLDYVVGTMLGAHKIDSWQLAQSPYYQKEFWSDFTKYLSGKEDLLSAVAQVKTWEAQNSTLWLNREALIPGVANEVLVRLRQEYLRFRVHVLLAGRPINEAKFFERLVTFLNDQGATPLGAAQVTNEFFNEGGCFNPLVENQGKLEMRTEGRYTREHPKMRIYFSDDTRLIIEEQVEVANQAGGECGTLTARICCRVNANGELIIDAEQSRFILETDDPQLLERFRAAKHADYLKAVITALRNGHHPCLASSFSYLSPSELAEAAVTLAHDVKVQPKDLASVAKVISKDDADNPQMRAVLQQALNIQAVCSRQHLNPQKAAYTEMRKACIADFSDRCSEMVKTNGAVLDELLRALSNASAKQSLEQWDDVMLSLVQKFATDVKELTCHFLEIAPSCQPACEQGYLESVNKLLAQRAQLVVMYIRTCIAASVENTESSLMRILRNVSVPISNQLTASLGLVECERNFLQWLSEVEQGKPVSLSSIVTRCVPGNDASPEFCGIYARIVHLLKAQGQDVTTSAILDKLGGYKPSPQVAVAFNAVSKRVGDACARQCLECPHRDSSEGLSVH